MKDLIDFFYRSVSSEPKIQLVDATKETKQEQPEKKEFVISPNASKTVKSVEEKVEITKPEEKKVSEPVIQPSKPNLNFNTHVLRQVDNLKSDYVKLHLNWDDFESPRYARLLFLCYVLCIS